MSKVIGLILLIFFLPAVFSCTSLEDAAIESEEYHERAVNAVDALLPDMISELDFDIAPDLLEASLADEYTQYSEYSPMYKNIKDAYLSEVGKIVSRIIPAVYDDIEEMGYSLLSFSEDFIVGDTSFSERLGSELKGIVSDKIYNLLQKEEKSLDSAFSYSSREFSAIAESYGVLSRVGIDKHLNPPIPVDLVIVSDIATDELFRLLREAEKDLKNRAIDMNSDSVYSIFWEVK